MSASVYAAPIERLDVANAASQAVLSEAEKGLTSFSPPVLDQFGHWAAGMDAVPHPQVTAKLRRRPSPPPLNSEQQRIVATHLPAACRCRASISSGLPADPADWHGCETFFRVVHQWLEQYAERHVRPSSRDDFVQEVCRRAVEKLHEFDCNPSLASFNAWLWDVAEHLRIDLWRRSFARRRARAFLDKDELIPDRGESDLLAALGRQEDRRHVLAAMDELRGRVAEDDYRVLQLCDIEGIPINEAAVLVGNAPATVCDRRRRMKEKLRRILRRSG